MSIIDDVRARLARRRHPAQKDGTALPVAIIGAGFGGIATAVKLKQAGINDFVVFEKSPKPGGTWYHNTYPGCEVDLQKRSYLTNFICGDGTDQMCPGPAVPQFRNDNTDPNAGSAHLNPNGHLVVPSRTVLPGMVPFDRGE